MVELTQNAQRSYVLMPEIASGPRILFPRRRPSPSQFLVRKLEKTDPDICCLGATHKEPRLVGQGRSTVLAPRCAALAATVDLSLRLIRALVCLRTQNASLCLHLGHSTLAFVEWGRALDHHLFSLLALMTQCVRLVGSHVVFFLASNYTRSCRSSATQGLYRWDRTFRNSPTRRKFTSIFIFFFSTVIPGQLMRSRRNGKSSDSDFLLVSIFYAAHGRSCRDLILALLRLRRTPLTTFPDRFLLVLLLHRFSRVLEWAGYGRKNGLAPETPSCHLNA